MTFTIKKEVARCQTFHIKVPKDALLAGNLHLNKTPGTFTQKRAFEDSIYNLSYFQLTNAVTNRYYGTKGKEKEGRNQIVASLCVLLFVHFPLKINK